MENRIPQQQQSPPQQQASTTVLIASPNATAPPPKQPSFIMDFSLYRYSKQLRLLGCDVICQENIRHHQMTQHVQPKGRIVVTGSPKLLPQLERLRKEAEDKERIEAAFIAKVLGGGGRGKGGRIPPPGEDVGSKDDDEDLAAAVAAKKKQQSQRARQVVAYDSDGESIYEDDSSSSSAGGGSSPSLCDDDQWLDDEDHDAILAGAHELDDSNASSCSSVDLDDLEDDEEEQEDDDRIHKPTKKNKTHSARHIKKALRLVAQQRNKVHLMPNQRNGNYIYVNVHKDFKDQMAHIIRTSGVHYDARLIFTRCVNCNFLIEKIASKEQVKGKIHTSVYNLYENFYQCPGCEQVYWGMDNGVLVNYKAMRTVEYLKSFCQQAAKEGQEKRKQLLLLQQEKEQQQATAAKEEHEAIADAALMHHLGASAAHATEEARGGRPLFPPSTSSATPPSSMMSRTATATTMTVSTPTTATTTTSVFMCGHTADGNSGIQRHLFSYPRSVKLAIFRYLPEEDLDQLLIAFPMFKQLITMLRQGVADSFVPHYKRNRYKTKYRREVWKRERSKKVQKQEEDEKESNNNRENRKSNKTKKSGKEEDDDDDDNDVDEEEEDEETSRARALAAVEELRRQQEEREKAMAKKAEECARNGGRALPDERARRGMNRCNYEPCSDDDGSGDA